jgi:diguanylate cyclase (GGDEF)-like protein
MSEEERKNPRVARNRNKMLRLVGATTSVRTKIIGFALLATLIPSVGFGLLTYQNSKRILTESAATEMSGVSSHVAREIDLWFRERIYDVRVFSSSYVVQENLESYIRTLDAKKLAVHNSDAKAQIGNYLNLVHAKFAFYRRLSVHDPSGATVAETSPGGGELDLPDDWLRQAAEHKIIFGNMRPDDHNDHIVLPVAVPVQSAIGAFLGILVGEIDMHHLRDKLSALTADFDGKSYVLDRTGLLIAKNNGESSNTHSIDANVVADLFSNPKQLLEYEGIDSSQSVGVFAPVQAVDWGVVVERQKSIVFASVTELRNVTAAVVAILLVMIGLTAYLLSQGIVRPLQRLVSGASKISSGDLDVDLPIKRKDELGYTTLVFNSMVERLRENRAQLAAINEALQHKNSELEHISITDALTGIFNRRHMMNLLERHMRVFHRGKRPFSLLLLDIDHFKAVNDTYGHVVGDRILASVAGIVRDSLRVIDYAGRYGGEEFIVLLVDTGIEDAKRTAERIRSSVASKIHTFEANQINVTISIGIATYDNEREQMEDLIKRSDNALYKSKHEGRDRVTVANRIHIAAAN